MSKPPPIASSGGALHAVELFEVAKSAVWMIVAGRTVADFEEASDLSQGSAVAVSKSELLTNCHVVEDLPLIVLLQEETILLAELVSADPAGDRCVLLAEEPVLQPVSGIRRFDTLKVGEDVYTIGAPHGLQLSLGAGFVSGLRERAGQRLIQTTAPISPGSSGGGLFDGAGNLVGVTTFLLRDSQAIAFALSAEEFWD